MSGPIRVPLVPSTAAGFLFHDLDYLIASLAKDRPPPPIWRQLLTDVAWTIVILGAVIVGIVVSDLS